VLQPTVADLQPMCNRSAAPSFAIRPHEAVDDERKGEAMTRLISILVVAASLVLAVGTATATGGTRPDDRATHGPGAIGVTRTAAPARPDDRATHGPGAVAAGSSRESVRPDNRAWRGIGPAPAGGSRESVRPDNRAWRGIGPAPTVELVESPAVSVDGFDWVDAAVGASAMFGLCLLVAAGSLLVRRRQRLAVRAAILGVLVAAAVAAGAALAAPSGSHVLAWSTAQKLDEVAGNHADLNTPALDGCPSQSPDGLRLYLASNRPGGKGGLDIWTATRASRDAPWGAPQNLGEPVNSAADDFCPTPVGKGGLFFVSREALPGACGQGDIYYTHRTGAAGWAEPERLLCAPAGPNSELDEQGPSWVDASGTLRGRKLLYFSRSSVAPSVPGEIFVSERRNGARFGPATAVAELNDATANDIQPNVREDGLEVVLSSNRSGTLGAQDIWVATRASLSAPWSTPVTIGTDVNTPAAETRPWLSRDGKQLLFGRSPGPEGSSDIYVTTR
jgi:hypothetical protein